MNEINETTFLRAEGIIKNHNKVNIKTPKTEGKIKSDNVTKLTSKSARNASKQPGEMRTLINSV